MEYKTYCISTTCIKRSICVRNFYTLITLGTVFENQVKLTINNCEV